MKKPSKTAAELEASIRTEAVEASSILTMRVLGAFQLVRKDRRGA
jgi:hypothetical protein